MTFDDNARIGGGKVSHRGRNTAIGLGGGGIGVLAIVLISQLVGVDLTGFLGGSTQQAQPGAPIAECETGEDANERIDCRIAFAAESLDTYWADTFMRLDTLEGQGAEYRTTSIVIFEGQTSTGCGFASSAVGPFYCPGDQTIYLDTSFYDTLRTQFGSSGGPLAEMYVIAHEWGHHIQNVTGVINSIDRTDTGPESDAVRLELQADCYAGAWVGAASQIRDEFGTVFLEPVTQAQIVDALSAAAAVGDDHIQEATQGQVSPETWTHGSSEMRQEWFIAGHDSGPSACDTFAADAL